MVNIERLKGKHLCRAEIWSDSFTKTGAVLAVGKNIGFPKVSKPNPCAVGSSVIFSYLSSLCLVIYTGL
jgi:hypothetical protein